jgi:hypothetical protein
LGAPKEIWDLSRSRIYELGIWKIEISFVKLMNNPMCQIKVLGVLILCVKFGVVCISGQLLNLWVWQNHKNGIAKRILGHMWFPSYVRCVMGMEVFIIRFSGLLWTRNTKHGQLNSRKKDKRDMTPINLLSLHMLCYM